MVTEKLKYYKLQSTHEIIQSMKKGVYFIFSFLCIITIFSCQNSQPENISISNLRCEMLQNPEGIDAVNPNLSWVIESSQRNIRQTAYQILVASSHEKLSKNEGDIWNSGKISSDQSVHVKYNGQKLQSGKKYYWKVKVWSKNGETNWSDPDYWSMGLLNYKDWKGRWIGLDRSFEWDDETKFSRLSARYFRKDINIGEKEIENATIYLIGLGLYELHINGEKIGDLVLAPTPTDYTKNIKYNTFDVTKNLKNGVNTIGVVLGNGRYYTMRQKYKPYKIKTFGYPKLLLNIFINYKNGTSSVLSTDNSWKVTADGPIRSNNEYDGEEYDARKEMPQWNSVGFDDSKWLPAEFVQEPEGAIEAQMNENMKIMQVIKPVSIKEVSKGKYILDLGQNMAGWLKMKVSGGKGDRVTLRFAESLNEDGTIFTQNLRDAKVTDVYILKGEGVETWQPSFVYHGFRFAEITGYPGIPTVNDFEGCVIYDEMKVTGTFETSNQLINQIYKNAFWSVISNYKGMPIDCPQRNERMPWLGDRAIGCYGESFMVDNRRLYIKWLDDIKNSQKADGSISDVAPPYFRYYSDNMTWPGTYILVAQMLYNQYGLVDPVIRHYPYMKKWLDYMQNRYLENYILTKDSYGDWCAPPKTIEEGRGKSADVKYPSALISTAYFYHFLNIMQTFAGLSGNPDDIPVYKTLAESVKAAFNKKYFNNTEGYYGSKTLTDNILPFSFGLVDEEKKNALAEKVSEIIVKDNNGYLSVGLVGIQWLMRTLSDNGMDDIAFKIATNTSYPSWGYMVENGATTIWELWNANTAAPSMNSQNHVMLLGDLVIWFYENLAGIKSKEGKGFKEIIMKPDFFSGLDSLNASFYSVHGLVKSSWKRDDKRIEWNITIPANTTAMVYFPYQYSSEIKENGEKIKKGSGINKIKKDISNTIVELGSGTYKFICTNEN